MSLTQVRRSRRWMTGYWASAAIHLVGVAFDVSALRLLSKITLMPSLAVWSRTQDGPRLLAAALLASMLGDVLMELDLLLPGMAMFAAAHACYVAVFRRTDRDRRSWQAVAAYGILAAAVMVALWPGLGIYRAPVAGYALMLTANAVSALWYSRRTGLGGALFLASDSLIGAGIAGHDFPLRALLVKTTYGIGQYQIAKGLVSPAGCVDGQPPGKPPRTRR
jgi:uncharacterized membrane protein YhhN